MSFLGRLCRKVLVLGEAVVSWVALQYAKIPSWGMHPHCKRATRIYHRREEGKCVSDCEMRLYKKHLARCKACRISHGIHPGSGHEDWQRVTDDALRKMYFDALHHGCEVK